MTNVVWKMENEGRLRLETFPLALRIPAPDPYVSGGDMSIRILLVDDDETFLSVTAIALESEGCVVNVANDAYAALASLNEEHPDVIVCDLNMPGLECRELCHWVRSDPRMA